MVIGSKTYVPEKDDYDAYEELTKEYNAFLSNKKSSMTEEDAKKYCDKFLKNGNTNDIFGDYYDSEQLIQYNALKLAREGYRKKLISENAEDVEQKVNDLYPYELIFKYKIGANYE